MSIEILKNLEANPKMWPNNSESFSNEPMLLSEIENLEQLHNNGNPFPKALREWMFLAGNYCWVLGGGAIETQTFLRNKLSYFGLEITRPFIVFHAYGGAFDFVYLDEGEEDPKFYQGEDYTEPEVIGGTTPLIHDTGETLSERIEKLILSLRNAILD